MIKKNHATNHCSINMEFFLRIKEKSAIDLYLEDISKIPLLKKDEEFKLATEICHLREKQSALKKKLKLKETKPAERQKLRKKIEKVSADYETHKNKMVRRNCRLVINIAKKYKNNFLSLIDLIEEGNIGLLRAVEKFDPAKGFRFSTFAIWWIKQAIISSIKDKSSIIRIPKHVEKELNKYNKVYNRFIIKHGRAPTSTEIAERCNISKEKISSLLITPNDFISIDKQIGDSNKEISELLEDTNRQFSPIEELMNYSLKESLDKVLSKLTQKERTIIYMRYGLKGKPPMILEKIGDNLGITRERVRQLQAIALKKIRPLAKKAGLDIFK